MRIERFTDVNLLGIAGTEIDVPAGRAAAISLSYYGTNGAGATLALANVGLIRMTYQGEPKVNARAVSLFQYDDFKGGLPPFASAIGAGFRTTFHIPLRFGGYGPDNPDDNVMNIQHGQMRIFLPSPVTAVAMPAAVNCEVGLVMDPAGNARYSPYFFDSQHTLTGAYRVPITGPNVRAMMFQRPVGVATLPNSVQFSMNGGKVLEGPWQMIEDNTNIYNRIEAAAVQAILAEFGGPNPASWQGGRYSCLFVGGNAGDTMWVSELGAQSCKTSEYLRTKDAAISDLQRFRSASDSPSAPGVSPAVPTKIPGLSQAADRDTADILAPAGTSVSPNVSPNYESV